MSVLRGIGFSEESAEEIQGSAFSMEGPLGSTFHYHLCVCVCVCVCVLLFSLSLPLHMAEVIKGNLC